MAAGDASEITVIARALARPEYVGGVRMTLKDMVVPTRAEKGCISYELHEVLGDPYQFVFFEIWESEAALQAHLQTPHFQDLERTQGMMAGPLKVTKLKKLL